ncbi:hypothetical protein [Methylobacterium longum]|uniref:Uncharacterized protein n=1 Tax=Methylobacterium longum TaxID=767694 RepID=A0ABT8AND3_9HYPH|nr:hypothetical protein [Methylobacterium longum]MDN3571294.1 hypothetical protein [Methylobacterium longum]
MITTDQFLRVRRLLAGRAARDSVGYAAAAADVELNSDNLQRTGKAAQMWRARVEVRERRAWPLEYIAHQSLLRRPRAPDTRR